MKSELIHRAELSHLWLLHHAKEMEITINAQWLVETNSEEKKIEVLKAGKQLLIDQRNLLSKISEKIEFIKSKFPNHEEKATTKI